jgi:hypothetical protein
VKSLLIKALRNYLVAAREGGAYFSQKQACRLIDNLIAIPMSAYLDYKASRTSWALTSKSLSTSRDYVANSAEGLGVLPVFGARLSNELAPVQVRLDASEAPGFGLNLSPAVKLIETEGSIAT